MNLFSAADEKTGRTFRVVEDNFQMKCMKAAGFVSVEEKELKCPLADWPKDPVQKQVGVVTKEALLSDLEGMCSLLSSMFASKLLTAC